MTMHTLHRARGIIPLLCVIVLAACQKDETLSAYAADRYRLTAINGTAFTATATLDLSQPDRISGEAPCNSYFADQTAPYPWFAPGPIGTTRRACPELAAETDFLRHLATMEFAETLGDVLLLTNSAGDELVFQALP